MILQPLDKHILWGSVADNVKDTSYNVDSRIINEWGTCNQDVCRSLFVILSHPFWSFYCLSFFDLRLLITPLVSSNFFLL